MTQSQPSIHWPGFYSISQQDLPCQTRQWLLLCKVSPASIAQEVFTCQRIFELSSGLLRDLSKVFMMKALLTWPTTTTTLWFQPQVFPYFTFARTATYTNLKPIRLRQKSLVLNVVWPVFVAGIRGASPFALRHLPWGTSQSINWPFALTASRGLCLIVQLGYTSLAWKITSSDSSGTITLASTHWLRSAPVYTPSTSLVARLLLMKIGLTAGNPTSKLWITRVRTGMAKDSITTLFGRSTVLDLCCCHFSLTGFLLSRRKTTVLASFHVQSWTCRVMPEAQDFMCGLSQFLKVLLSCIRLMFH